MEYDRRRAQVHDRTAEASTFLAPGRRTLTEALPPIQGKGIRPDAGEPAAPPAPSGAGSPLPAGVQSKMERAFGADFSAIRVHQDGAADAVGAQAFARGTDLHFAPGRYDPHSQAGQELLGHELAHTVQQAQGRVGASAQPKGGAIHSDAGLEREADDLGARAARGEIVAASGAVGARGGVAQAKIIYDETWAALGGYGGWHPGKGELWAQVSTAYNDTYLTLLAWLAGDGSAKRTLLDTVEPGTHALRKDLATIATFRSHDNKQISVTIGQSIHDVLIPILNTNPAQRLNDWYGTQLEQERAKVVVLEQKLAKVDAATVHGSLNLLAKKQEFLPHKEAREVLQAALKLLKQNTKPDHIANELAAKTRPGDRTYDTWIDVIVQQYAAAKDEIQRAKLKDKQEQEEQRLRKEKQEEEERLEQEKILAQQQEVQRKIVSWAGGSTGMLQKVYSDEQLLQLAAVLHSSDAGRVAMITSKVKDLDSPLPQLIKLLIEHKDRIADLARVMTKNGKVAFTLLAGGAALDSTEEIVNDAKGPRFIELFDKPAIALVKANQHAEPLAAFTALCAKRYLEDAWLSAHLAKLHELRTKVENTPGIDHFVRNYGKAGVNAVVAAGTINDHGTVDLSVLREQLQSGAGITYYPYDSSDTANLGGSGSVTRKKFARDSAAELRAFKKDHERTNQDLTFAEKLRFTGKTEEDVRSKKKDREEVDKLKTWSDLSEGDRGTLKGEDDRELRDLKVKATMQLVKSNGEVFDHTLQVFVSGGERTSGYRYKGDGGTKMDKQTGQKASKDIDDLTYNVTGQTKGHYDGVDHQHIGHHEGERDNDAEVKIVSQAVALLGKHASTLTGGTLRIFVDRYTCPNCSDVLYKAKTTNKLLGKLAAVEVIYTGART
jgi:hypothetical protein